MTKDLNDMILNINETNRLLILVLERIDTLVLVLEKQHAELKDTLQAQHIRTDFLVENRLRREQSND